MDSELLAHPFVATLWSLVMLLVGGELNNLRSARSIAKVNRELEDHEDLPAHRESLLRHEGHDRQLTALANTLSRLEGKIDDALARKHAGGR